MKSVKKRVWSAVINKLHDKINREGVSVSIVKAMVYIEDNDIDSIYRNLFLNLLRYFIGKYEQ